VGVEKIQPPISYFQRSSGPIVAEPTAFLWELGIAFISKFAIATELKAKTLTAIRVHDLTINRELKIVHRKDKHLSRAAVAFIEMARDH